MRVSDSIYSSNSIDSTEFGDCSMVQGICPLLQIKLKKKLDGVAPLIADPPPMKLHR